MSNVDESGTRMGIGRRARPLAAIVTLVVLLAVVALPTLAADPSASPGPSSAEPAASAEPVASAEPAASAEPEESAEPDESAEPAGPAAQPDQTKPEKGPKEKQDKAPEQAVTLQGTVRVGTDEDGAPTYELASGGKTYTLDAGPPWYYGDNHPLKPFVGESVTVSGEAAAGSTDVDVLAVNGTAIREAGKPPWAGGWKRVGERHPGWSEEKAARWAEKAAKQQQKFGGCWPPGQCKEQGAAESGAAPNP
jgi:hypothetical protein